MFFYMPTKIYAEKNAVHAHASELCALGKNALIVTGRSSAEKNGSLTDVTDALKKGGVTYAHFNEVEENPSIETVMKARDIGIAEGCDFCIGIGGGSPMDAAKAIAVMMDRRDETEGFLYDASRAVTKALPLALIPTTCGTGSESTPYSILTRHALKTKAAIPHKIFADLSLIDGKYLRTAPAHILLDTTTDALAHLFESFINVRATDYSKLCVYQGLKLWQRSQKILSEGARSATDDDLFNMLNTSMIAGMAISHTGTSLPHGLSYAVTYATGMPHGKACGYFLPGYLREADAEQATEVLQMAGFADTDALERYYEDTCGRDAVAKEILERAVADIMENEGKRTQPPFPVDEPLLRRVVGI